MNLAPPPPPDPATEARLAAALAPWHRLADAGLLRRIASATAELAARLDPAQAPAVAAAAACVAQLEGQGHTAVPVALLAQPPQAWLGVPPSPALLASLAPLASALPRSEAQWLQQLGASPAVACIDRAQALRALPVRAAPLLLVRADAHGPAMLGLQRHVRSERGVALALQQRAAHLHSVDPAVAAAALRRAFPATVGTAHGAGDEPDWQAVACAVALRAGLTVLTGGPGTGKTTTAARLLAVLWATHPQPQSFKLALAAPTGKAAARLQQALRAGLQGLTSLLDAAWLECLPPAQTLHSLLGVRPDGGPPRHHAGCPLDVDLLLLDEASMVHLDLMAQLLAALPAHARLVLLGDKDQLASVEAGAVLGDLCAGFSGDAAPACPDADTHQWVRRLTGCHWPTGAGAAAASPVARQTVLLRKSHRFAGGIGRLAQAVNQADAAALAAMAQQPPADVAWVCGVQAALARLDELVLAHWGQGVLPLLRQGPPAPADDESSPWSAWALEVLRAFDAFRILCALHGGALGTEALNRRVQALLHRAGLPAAGRLWHAGKPVLVTRNDASLGLSNGDVGVVLPVPRAQGAPVLKACFALGERVHAVPVGRLAHVQAAYALSVHKSQGSEFAHVALVLPPLGHALLSRELAYTGITRAKQSLTVLEPSPGCLLAASAQPTRRGSGLAAWLSAAAAPTRG